MEVMFSISLTSSSTVLFIFPRVVDLQFHNAIVYIHLTFIYKLARMEWQVTGPQRRRQRRTAISLWAKCYVLWVVFPSQLAYKRPSRLTVLLIYHCNLIKKRILQLQLHQTPRTHRLQHPNHHNTAKPPCRLQQPLQTQRDRLPSHFRNSTCRNSTTRPWSPSRPTTRTW